MSDMDKGVQPLDEIMTRLNLKNSDLVEKSDAQLSHKVVGKARKGRQLTLNAQLKVLKALNALQPGQHYKLIDLFNYPGKE
jgi:hypothetical protein